MRLITVLILLSIGGFAFSQDPLVSLSVVTKDDASGKKLSLATVDVYKEDKLFISKQSASNGKVPPIDLPLNAEYKIVIHKDGYVQKIALLNSHFEFPDDLPPYLPFSIQTSLFKSCEASNFDFLEKESMINFKLDQNGQQTWDHEYTKNMLKRIESSFYNNLSELDDSLFTKYYYGGAELMEFYKFEDALVLLKKAQEIVDCEFMADKIAECEEKAIKQAEFDAHIIAGDEFLKDKEYGKATTEYRAASEIWPQEMYPEGQIIEIQYLKVTDKAREFFEAKDYEKAKSLYERCLTLKPSDPYPQQKLDDINKLLETK